MTDTHNRSIIKVRSIDRRAIRADCLQLKYWRIIMAKANSAPAKGRLTQTANAVDALILKAGKADASTRALTVEAAKLAADELDSTKPLADRIAIVMAAHSAAFATAGHNVKAIFADALTLLAAGSEKVQVPTFDATGRKVADVTQAVDATAAVDLAKHTMRDAARQVREHAGIGRKVAPKQPVAKLAVTKESNEVLCTRVLTELGDAIKVEGFPERLIRFLDAAGYVCARKVKVQNAKPAPVKTMADLPKVIVQGAAQTASA